MSIDIFWKKWWFFEQLLLSQTKMVAHELEWDGSLADGKPQTIVIVWI
jgi:hypothetical protein